MAIARAIHTFSIKPFDPSTPNWTCWLQRLEGAFKICEIKDEARVSYLLLYVGADAYGVLSDWLAPNDPFEQPYQRLTIKLKQYYAPVPLEIAENFKFNMRRQRDGETVREFVSALYKMSQHCNFENHLKKAIRNQLVFGLANKRVQVRLLEVKDLTLEKAIQIATSMELSEKVTEELQDQVKVALVQTKKKKNRKTSSANKSYKAPEKCKTVTFKQAPGGGLARPKMTLNLDAGGNTAGTSGNLGGQLAPKKPGGLSLGLPLEISTARISADLVDVELPLERQGWYHGSITRIEAEGLLRVHQEGSYLVRNSESTKQDYSLSLKSARGFMHMRIQKNEELNAYILGQFSKPFDNIPEMVRHFSVNRLPIRGAEHMCLLHPVIVQLL